MATSQASGEPAVRQHPLPQTPQTRVTLMGGFELERDGARLSVPAAAQRPLALLAMQPHPLSRAHIAGRLWPDASEEHASGSLRSALWRLRSAGFTAIERRGDQLALSPSVEVDVRRLVSDASLLQDEDAGAEVPVGRFVGELLPDWYDDWVVVERERVRQVCLHALEALAARLTRTRRFPEAIDAALAAVRAEPFRESAHRALVRVHLAEGNRHEALRQYHLCRDLLARELGAQPSPLMEELIHAEAAPAGTPA